jgi:hypothetical protein
VEYKYPIFLCTTGNNREKMEGEYFQVSFTKQIERKSNKLKEGGLTEFLAKG